MKQCELSQTHEAQIGNAGPKPYSTSSFHEHYPTVRNAQELMAMMPIAQAACDSLR
jgi:hypothetical protein